MNFIRPQPVERLPAGDGGRAHGGADRGHPLRHPRGLRAAPPGQDHRRRLPLGGQRHLSVDPGAAAGSDAGSRQS